MMIVILMNYKLARTTCWHWPRLRGNERQTPVTVNLIIIVIVQLNTDFGNVPKKIWFSVGLLTYQNRVSHTMNETENILFGGFMKPVPRNWNRHPLPLIALYYRHATWERYINKTQIFLENTENWSFKPLQFCIFAFPCIFTFLYFSV